MQRRRQTFSEYLNSRTQLIESFGLESTVKMEYKLKRYHTIALLNEEGDEFSLRLKPSHDLVVEWQCDVQGNVIGVNSISIEDFDIDETSGVPKMSTDKFTKWIARHTI